MEEVSKFPSLTHDEYVDILCYAIQHQLIEGTEQAAKLSKGAFSGLM